MHKDKLKVINDLGTLRKRVVGRETLETELRFRAFMKFQQQLGLGTAAMQLPPAPRAQRAGHLSDSESHSGSAQSTRSPRGVQPPTQVMGPMQMQPDRAPSHFVPAGNVTPMPAYGQPVQIPRGYAFVPAHPQMAVPSSFLLPSGLS